MRLLLEVLAVKADEANFPTRQGGTEKVPFVAISGVDSDYMDSLLKVKVFRPKNITRLNGFKKGDRIKVKFRTLKRDDKFEKCTIVNCQEDDIELFSDNALQQPASAMAA
jgi:hypothetical protein